MTYVNVHEGASDNGNYSSRGSAGCITIHPDDFDDFTDNFDWSGASGNTGNSFGTIEIHRSDLKLEQISARENGAKYDFVKDVYVKQEIPLLQ